MIRCLRWPVLMGLLGLATAGCSPTTGSVSGKVTFEGKDLPVGTVIFHPEKGTPVSGSIFEGKYTVEKVPLGEAKVGITVPAPAPASFGPPGAKVGREKMMPPKGAPVPPGFDPTKGNTMAVVKIPTLYGDAGTTPLKYTVVAGKQEKDFDLK